MPRRRSRRLAALAGLTAAVGAATVVGSVLAATWVKPYVEPVGGEYEVTALP